MTLPEKYTCEDCGGVFDTDWTEAEAQDEARSLFGANVFAAPVAIVCDECFKKYKPQ